MMTEPSSSTRLVAVASSAEQGGDFSSNDDSSNSVSTTTTTPESPVLAAEDLYDFPPDLRPVYRRLDWLEGIIFSGFFGNIVLSWDASLQSKAIQKGFELLFVKGPINAMTALMLQWQQHASWGATLQWLRWLVGFVVRYAVITAVPLMILQERFLRPSRISSQALKEQYVLPSTLSRFEQIPVQAEDEATTIGLHWLEYHNANKSGNNERPRKLLHLSHGFGASSLSWLPCLKTLTSKLGCSLALAHDKLGFGFSEAPTDNDYFWFTEAGSSRIVASLLEQKSLGLQQNYDSLVLVGHSMGTLTTLRLALELPKDIPKKVILVAPALGLRDIKGHDSKKQKRRNPFSAVSWIVYRSAAYVLRRAVGTPGFWRFGLKGAWGDSNRLTDSDVLRFQWPSVHKGWEAGLLRFAKASGLSIVGYDKLGPIRDAELLRSVLALPNTTVEVILGEKDPVVRSTKIRNFLAPFSADVRIEELPGLGHDPFEEDVEAFLGVIS